ncbi:MAG TPA: dihydrolipoamide acetyltransferase family protein [Bacteroidales bacterium]|nr:dihydrolipoamide acetyltransferase family protein [Bacteroidales bacterium]
MATFEIVMPKLGESIIEATIIKWLKQEGEKVAEDEAIAEIATDKVDSEIPSPVEGVMAQLLFKEGEVVPVGKTIAVIDLDGDSAGSKPPAAKPEKPAKEAEKKPARETVATTAKPAAAATSRFLSPLVKNIAAQEKISAEELETIPGTGKDNRITKDDLMNWLQSRSQKPAPAPPAARTTSAAAPPPPAVRVAAGDEVVEMDRMRQLIASHMVRSMQTSPHVTSFVEADVTELVRWRERIKDSFRQRENIKITFTPVFIEAIAKALRDHPGVNVSVDGTRIIRHKNVNVGMAVALPGYNLIVPVIRQADQKNLIGITREVNDLAERARAGKLVPDEIMEGTISLTNLGSFGTLMGSPIINQPQTAIVATGIIRKRPVVIETPAGDSIAIRHVMIASLTFDHRVIDGALAGDFLNSFVKYLEHFDTNQPL